MADNDNLSPEERVLYDRLSALRNSNDKFAFYSVVPFLRDTGISLSEGYLNAHPRRETLLVDETEDHQGLALYTERGEHIADFASFGELKEYQKMHYPDAVMNSMAFKLPGKIGNGLFDGRFDSGRDQLEWVHKSDRVRMWLQFKADPSFRNGYLLVEGFFTHFDASDSYRGATDISGRMGYTEDNKPFVTIPQVDQDMTSRNRADLHWTHITGDSLNDAYVKAAQHIIENYDWNGDPR